MNFVRVLKGGVFWCLLGEKWVKVVEWAMLVPDCIVLSLLSLLSAAVL